MTNVYAKERGICTLEIGLLCEPFRLSVKDWILELDNFVETSKVMGLYYINRFWTSVCSRIVLVYLQVCVTPILVSSEFNTCLWIYYHIITVISDIGKLQIVEVVCCQLTPLQSELYNHIIQSKNVGLLLVPIQLYIASCLVNDAINNDDLFVIIR